MKHTLSALCLLAAIILGGCASLKPKPVTLVTVQAVQVEGPAKRVADAYSELTLAFVNRGFDIKTTNEGAGLVITEYKKYASFGNPPFDYYIQIRGVVTKGRDDLASVQLSPIVKAQNRFNAASYTENELDYYTGDETTIVKIGGMNDGWRTRGLTMVMNVASDIAEVMGVSVDDVEQIVTETPMEFVPLSKELRQKKIN